MKTYMDDKEIPIVEFFNRGKSNFLDTLSATISSILFLAFSWFVIVMVIISADIYSGLFLILGLALVFAIHFALTEGFIKWGGKFLSLRRTRPFRAYPERIRPIGRKFSDSSFPSSHMASMVGGFVVITEFYAFLLPWVVAATLIMAWSRLRNGMHYPSDILAGIALGLGYGFLALHILASF